MKKILVLLPVSENGTGIYKDYYCRIQKIAHRYADSSEIIIKPEGELTAENLKDVSAIIGNPVPEILGKADKLEWLQLDFAGTDKYIDYARKNDRLTLTNASGAFGRTMAEYVLTGIFCLYKHFNIYRDYQRMHIWKDAGSEISIFGKNVLIIGTGDIGTETAKILRPFAARITGINRRGGENEEFDEVDTSDKLAEYIPDSDIIISCVPKNKSTDNLMSRENIDIMKNTAIFINVGRSNCVDMEALADALYEKRILGACVDVYDAEPLPRDSRLWELENLIVTPHISGKTYGHLDGTVRIALDICVGNLERYLKNETLVNVVDKESGYRNDKVYSK